MTCGGAPVFIWPGGITIMADVSRILPGSFGSAPAPAPVAPIEFTLRLSDHAALGGYMDHVQPIASVRRGAAHQVSVGTGEPWPLRPAL